MASASEVTVRHRSRSRSRPPAPDQEPPPVKPKRRWRRKSTSVLGASNGSLAGNGRTTSMTAEVPGAGGEDELATTSDAAAGSEDGSARRRAPPQCSDSSDASDISQDCDATQHVGRRVISMEVPVHIDKLFTMLFTNSDFFQAFYQRLKYYDVTTSEWEDGENGCKTRRNRFMVDAMGKTTTSTVTEDQTMLPISRPGSLYVINAEVKNSGVPMADVFYTTKHYCIHKLSSKRTKLEAWCQTKFRKSTLFKGFIEKTANEGMEEHHSTLEQILNEWLRDPNRRRRRDGGSGDGLGGGQPSDAATNNSDTGTRSEASPAPTAGTGRGLLLLVLGLTLLLLALNGYLYLRMSRLGLQTEMLLHSGLFQAGVSADPEWLERLTSVQQRDERHRAEAARWQQAVRAAAELVRQSESALNQLQGTLEVETDPDTPQPSPEALSPPPPTAAAEA